MLERSPEYMTFQHPICDDQLVRDVLDHKHHIEYSVHGLAHWQRVERNGLFLGSAIGADLQVVSLFALFHDSQRINDFEDPDHGARGAQLADRFYRQLRLSITPEQFDILEYSCIHHTERIHHENITVQCCWDADRLDLTRVGVLPDPELLNTELAKEVADKMDYSVIEAYNYSLLSIKQE